MLTFLHCVHGMESLIQSIDALLRTLPQANSRKPPQESGHAAVWNTLLPAKKSDESEGVAWLSHQQMNSMRCRFVSACRPESCYCESACRSVVSAGPMLHISTTCASEELERKVRVACAWPCACDWPCVCMCMPTSVRVAEHGVTYARKGVCTHAKLVTENGLS